MVVKNQELILKLKEGNVDDQLFNGMPVMVQFGNQLLPVKELKFVSLRNHPARPSGVTHIVLVVS